MGFPREEDEVQAFIRKWKEEGETERPRRPAVHQSNRERSRDHLYNDLSVDREAHLAKKRKAKNRRTAIPGSGGWTIDSLGVVYTAQKKKAKVEYDNHQARVQLPRPEGGRPSTMVSQIQLEVNHFPRPFPRAVVFYRDGNFDNLRIENLRWIGDPEKGLQQNSRNVGWHKMLGEQNWNMYDNQGGRKKDSDSIYSLFANVASKGVQITILNDGLDGEQ